MAEAASATTTPAAAPAAPAARDAGGSGRSGVERAAILLLTLGEKEAAEVLRHLSAKDVQRVGAAMAQLANVSRAEVAAVLESFSGDVEGRTSLGVGADEFIRRTLTHALGEERATGVIDRILMGRASKGLDALKWMDARSIAQLVREEHPQIVAIVLAWLEAEQAAQVVALLPEAARAEVIMRIATLEGVQPAALQELDEIIERQFASAGASHTAALGGMKAAANILNFLEPAMEGALISDIGRADETLGARIQDLLFVFDNLLELDDRGMQELLRQVTSDQLLLALKAADDALKDKVFKNMSQRAAEMLKDDLAARGPARLSEVEAAQKEILAVARKLAEEGTINLGGKGGEAYV